MRWPALLVFVLPAVQSRAFAQVPGAAPAPAASATTPEPVAAPTATSPSVPPPSDVAPSGSSQIPPTMPAFAGPMPVAPLPAAPPPAAPPPAPPPNAPVASPVRVTQTKFAIELGGGLDVSARFPRDNTARSAEEVVDSVVGIGAWAGSRRAVYGLTVERIGFGKDHYSTNANGETLNATYLADTLWFAGRWYFTDARPAFYLSFAAGPALPEVRATGTRAPAAALVAPPEAYECSKTGRVGLGLGAAAGEEFDIAESWSFLAEARFSGHFMSSAGDAFSGCAPGSGPAMAGTLRLGLAYRFGE